MKGQNILKKGDEQDGDAEVSLTEKEIEELVKKETATNENKLTQISLKELKILPPVKEKNKEKKFKKEKEEVKNYFYTIGFILSNNTPFNLDEASSKEEIKNYFQFLQQDIASGDSMEAKKIKARSINVFQELKEVETPEVLKSIHQRLVSLAKYATQQNEKVVLNGDDPLALALLVGKIEAGMGEELKIEKEIENILKKYNLEKIKEDKKEDQDDNKNEDDSKDKDK